MKEFKEFVYKDGTRYRGETINDLPYGMGIFESEDEFKYIGEFKNGYYNGHGTMFLKGKHFYTGEWKNSEMDGFGEITHDDGSRYIGNFKNGIRDGEGIYIYPDGTKQIGSFKNDFLNGKAITKYDEEEVEFGEFINDTRIGIGIDFDDEYNGKYIKFWNDNKISNFGIDIYNNFIEIGYNLGYEEECCKVKIVNENGINIKIVKNNCELKDAININQDNEIYIGDFDKNCTGYGKMINDKCELIGNFKNGTPIKRDGVKITGQVEEIKVGKYVLQSMKEFFDGKTISENIIMNLLDKEYCKEKINVNYPLLREVNLNQPINEQLKINGVIRYWIKDMIKINGKTYAMCSQWYEWNKESFKNWLSKIKELICNS